MADNLEGYTTVNGAAKKMGRSTEQIRRYLREGKLPGRRIGGQWFIREVAVAYRTRQRDVSPMTRIETGDMENLPGLATGARIEAFERINRRREDIRRRWEREGTKVDAVELLREIRNEEP